MANLDPKTPPQQFHTLHETPAVAKRTHDADYRHGSLEQGQVAVLEELCSVQEVSLEWFLSNLSLLLLGSTSEPGRQEC